MQLVSTNINPALAHSTACCDLLDHAGLDDALRYCTAQGIEPPFPRCAKGDPDYARCLEIAKATLSDYGWWEKRLKIRHARRASARR